MGFWKNFGKIASIAAPIVAAPFTGGLSLALIGAGAGAAGGLIGGGGLKGALMGAGLGAIPGVGAGGGLAKGAVAPALGVGLKQAAKAAVTPLALEGAGLAAHKIASAKQPTTPSMGSLVSGQAPTTQSGGSMPNWGQIAKDWGPLAAEGVGLFAGAKTGQKATSMAMERSPEELAALAGARGVADQSMGAGKQLFGKGDALLNQGTQYLQQPANFYQTLLSGNRAQMAGVVAPAASQIAGNYRGAARGLEHSGVRGAARDVAKTDLNRERVSKIAGLTTGVQGAAAEGLAGLGGQALGAASPMYGAGASLYNNSGNVYGNLLTAGTSNRKYAREEGGKAGAAAGKLAATFGNTLAGLGNKKTATPAGVTAPPLTPGAGGAGITAPTFGQPGGSPYDPTQWAGRVRF